VCKTYLIAGNTFGSISREALTGTFRDYSARKYTASYWRLGNGRNLATD